MRARSLLSPIATIALLTIPGAVMAQSPAAMPAKSTMAAAPTHPVTEEQAGLLKEARIQPAEAQHAALARVPNGKVTKAEIEKEHDKLIYSYDIAAAGVPGITEVHVDAKSGKVLSTEHEKAGPAAPKPATSSPTPAK